LQTITCIAQRVTNITFFDESFKLLINMRYFIIIKKIPWQLNIFMSI